MGIDFPNRPPEKITRREVLTGLAATTLGLSFAKEIFDGSPGPALPEGLDETQFKGIVRDVFEERAVTLDGYSSTLAQTAMTFLAEVLLVALLEKKGIETGNASFVQSKRGKEITEKLAKLDYDAFVEMVVKGPLVEEVLFRLLPSKFLTENGKVDWETGVPLAGAFAAMHNVVLQDDGTRKFSTESIPIQQFISGLLYWYLMRKKGFSHAFLGHAAHNAVPAGAIMMSSYFDRLFKHTDE